MFSGRIHNVFFSAQATWLTSFFDTYANFELFFSKKKKKEI